MVPISPPREQRCPLCQSHSPGHPQQGVLAPAEGTPMCPASSCSGHSCHSPKHLEDGDASWWAAGGSRAPLLKPSSSPGLVEGCCSCDPEAPGHPGLIKSPFGCPLVLAELAQLRLELLGSRRRLLVESLVPEPSPGQGGACPPAAWLQESGHEMNEISTL